MSTKSVYGKQFQEYEYHCSSSHALQWAHLSVDCETSYMHLELLN